ncbi:hypothetical protein [Halarchaeum grantii]|uniref:hypothetical protein n=1 Tax=Halarchaeum grantii TaxID=1193105 RepID=UPI00166E3E0F|nr:hypothetical protein [Halarchaeum grantii]
MGWQRDICRTCGTGVPSAHDADGPAELSSRIAPTTTQYCQYCGGERETVSTVAWQDDLCQGCQGGLTKTPVAEAALSRAPTPSASANASPSKGHE